jgi:AraC-like DNA-binding protein
MRAILFSVPASEDSVVTEEDRLPFFYNYYHRHKEIQVTMILKGEGTLVVDNFNQPFREGEIYIIGSNQPHIFKSSHTHFENITKNRVHAFHIYMDSDKIRNLKDLPEMNNINRFLENSNHGFQIPAWSSERALRSIEKIRHSTGLPKLLSFIELLQYFSEESKNWKSLSSGVFECAPVEADGRINLIYEYTLQHYKENITLEKIAQVSYMTPQAFCKYFKKHTSKTYITFLQEIRVHKACKKIFTGEFETISSLAYACGFNSPINFHKVFKKYIGLAPSEYIRKHRLDETRKTLLLAS